MIVWLFLTLLSIVSLGLCCTFGWIMLTVCFVTLFIYGVRVYRAASVYDSDKPIATVLAVVINLLLTPYIGFLVIKLLIRCGI